MNTMFVFYFFIFLFSWIVTKGMEDHDYNAGKYLINRTRQYSALGSVTSGFAFFTVTASRNMHLPYWIKRTPLFGFICFNALGHLPTISGTELSQEKTAYIGNLFNRIKQEWCK